MAAGLAMPRPAMSCALPWATEENRIGVPMVSAATALRAMSFAAMCPWSCSMTTKASMPCMWNMMSAPNGPLASIPSAIAASIAGLMISISSRPNRPPSPACGLRPPTAIFAAAVAQPLKRTIGGADHAEDPFARNQVYRVAHAPVKRGVHDLHAAEAEHQVGVGLIAAGRARDKRRIAVELDAGARDRGLVLRHGDHGIRVAAERGIDRDPRKSERGASTRRAGRAEMKRRSLRLGAGEDMQAIVRPVRVRDPLDHTDGGRHPARLGVTRDHARIADHDRMAHLANRRVERGLEADLRPDTGGVAGSDGDFRLIAHARVPASGPCPTATASARRGSRPARPRRRPT